MYNLQDEILGVRDPLNHLWRASEEVFVLCPEKRSERVLRAAYSDRYCVSLHLLVPVKL